MGVLYTNIDDLLDETAEIAEEVPWMMLNQIEIDELLDNTRDW